MVLKYQKEIDKINNCPLSNEKGDKDLFRFIKEKPLSDNSFAPYGVINKKKYSHTCKAWGLSAYNSLKNANEVLQNLPGGTRESFVGIAKATITDNDGVKYQTGRNKNHYTFFPDNNLNLLTKFAIV